MSKIFVSLDIESITNVDVVGIGLQLEMKMEKF